MARKARTPLHNSSLPGMPGKRSLRRQAMQIARSSVTPKSEITHQYNRAQTDTTGFTQALIGLLQGQQGAYTSAANDALTQQQGIDTAAVSRLNGLGASIAPAAQVATGALGDTAASRLVGQGEALKAYGAQQPGVAASRGALAHLGLTNAEQDALQQRRDQVHQAYMQAYPQVRTNAFNEAMAIQNLHISKRQLADAESAQAQSQANTDRAFREQQREFNLSRKDSRQAAAAAGGSASASSKAPWDAYGMTATQWRSATTDAISQANKAANQGVPAQQFLDELTRVGNVPIEVAIEAMRRIYGHLRSTNPRVHPKLEAAYQSYQHWLSQYYAQTGGTTPSQRAGRHR